MRVPRKVQVWSRKHKKYIESECIVADDKMCRNPKCNKVLHNKRGYKQYCGYDCKAEHLYHTPTHKKEN